jgi:hypothetical protein
MSSKKAVCCIKVDSGMDRVYLLGKHLVNRTGIYAVVQIKQ